MAHDHQTILFTAEFWDDRYASAEQIWSGNPNPRLVAEVGRLPPGDALDVGCGEGADAIWLAAAGWQVTAVDISKVALTRAAAHAAARGSDVAGRISWRVADVLWWAPEPDRYDLVSAQFMHLPRPAMESLHRRLAAAVRPGGTLLVVLHHPDDSPALGGPDMHATADELAAVLDPDAWATISSTSAQRSQTTTGGGAATRRDAVLRAVRRSA
jgi:SAM-dependent methyltransferase